MKQEELEAIGAYVKTHITDWMREADIIPFSSGTGGPSDRIDRDFSLAERIVRVEEAIKHHGDILEKLIHQIDKRFEQVEKRFEQIDKRFEQVEKRFEQIDRRFESLEGRFNRITAVITVGFLFMTALLSFYKFLV